MFVGVPCKNDNYGYFVSCIAKAMNNEYRKVFTAEVIRGETLANIADKYVRAENPDLNTL